MEFGEITVGLMMSEMFFCKEYSYQRSEILSMRNSYCLYIEKLDVGFQYSCDPVHVKNVVFLGGGLESVGGRKTYKPFNDLANWMKHR